METNSEGLELETSFLLLRNHARNHNRRLADVAMSITTGTAPPSALDRLPPRRSARS